MSENSNANDKEKNEKKVYCQICNTELKGSESTLCQNCYNNLYGRKR